MTKRPYVIDEMISAKAIAARIEQLSREIHDEFKDTNKLVVVGLLRGSFVFIADLVRELDLPVEVDFLEASSYGDGMESSREVRILKDLRGAIEAGMFWWSKISSTRALPCPMSSICWNLVIPPA